MAQNTLNDGSSGDVVIRPGPPVSGGSGGSGGGGFGGNRVGASGAFSGPSKKTRNARRRAKQEYLQAQEQKRLQSAAQAQEQALVQARLQTQAEMGQRYDAIKAELDRKFADRTTQLTQLYERELTATRRLDVSELLTQRTQLYDITKEKNKIDELIASKTAEFNEKNALARSYDGHDPLVRTASDYLIRLGEFGDALTHGHQSWENAYSAAHEARLLTTQIDSLHRKSNALALEQVVWTQRLAAWEQLRQQAEQRDARIRFKQQADEDARVNRVRLANTLSLPAAPSVSALSMLLNPRGLWVAGAADELAVAVARATTALGGAMGTLTRPQVAIFVVGMIIPSELGNGELTAEQRARLFHAVSIPVQALNLYDSQELRSIADAGGSIEVEHRLKPLPMPEGTAIVLASTGGEIDSRVPVLNAELDPLTGQYTARIPGSPTRHVQFTPEAAPLATQPNQSRLTVSEPQFQEVPAGVDWRIQDCIVCVPGMEPVYLSFDVPPMGSGVVTGTGQPAKADWWNPAAQSTGAAIPTQFGDQFRGREFTSFKAFDDALWQTLGEHRALASSFNELNKKRIEQGFAPYAPKNTWVGENREFELRYHERSEFWADAFNLDKISINTPNSIGGWVGVVPAVTPWPIPPASSWKPLVPPGSEHLGSTTSPAHPTDPVVYPGSPAIPVLTPNETFPAVDEGEIGASIPGYPGDMELPSPDALFRDRRDDPGVVTGVGQVVSGVWLGEAARGEGAPIPAHIADQLRGREFTNFHRFREAFWKAVAADSVLRHQFNVRNLSRMREGLAPYPKLEDQHGGRKTFELHHEVEVSMGGDVYGVDNISVMTPQRHIQLHKERNHDL